MTSGGGCEYNPTNLSLRASCEGNSLVKQARMRFGGLGCHRDRISSASRQRTEIRFSSEDLPNSTKEMKYTEPEILGLDLQGPKAAKVVDWILPEGGKKVPSIASLCPKE